MNWRGKITLACPRGQVVRIVDGASYDAVLKNAMNYAGDRDCHVVKTEILKATERTGPRTVLYTRDANGNLVNQLGHAQRRKRRRR